MLLARVVKPYMSDSQPQIIIVPGDIVRLTSRHAPAMEEGLYKVKSLNKVKVGL